MHIANLLIQIGAILLVSRLLSRALTRLGQPKVIAEILAGILLGPSALGLFWPEGMALLFPAASLDGLGIVSQLGLVLFMFLVGLEFDPRLLAGRGRASLAISNAGIVVPFTLGALLALGLHGVLAPEGVGRLPFALFLGTAMSVTAFPVLARILTERRLTGTPVGAMALAAAAANDVTAWCLLAAVVGIAAAGDVTAALTTTGLALAYGAFVWVVVRPMLARLGPRAGQVSTDVVGFAMLLLVGSASISEWIGVHALLGSFLIGAAMPRQSGLTTTLIERMEDVITVLLLPLFMAYSGLRTQIGLLGTVEDWLMCGLIILVASLGKFGGTALVARWAGVSGRDSVALGILMNTRGLMELVVLNAGLDIGIITDRLFAMMVVMALFTTWVTSPLLRWVYPSAPAASPPQTAPQAPTGLVLCVSDLGGVPSLVQLAAAWRAGAEGTAGEVHALHLRPTDRPADYLRSAEGEDQVLEAVREAAERRGLPVQLLSVPSGNPAEDIVRVAAEVRAGAVTLGIHRSSLGWDNFGGVTGHVLRECEAEVRVLVDRGLGELRRVGIVGEPGPALEAARACAARLARGAGAELVDGASEGVDLVVTPWTPGSAAPADGQSWLIVRARSAL